MDPIINNLRVEKGEICTIIGTVYPIPTSILNWTIAFRVKNNYGDAAFIISKAGVVTDPTNGEFSVTLAHGDTNITARVYVYDIWRTDGGSEVMLGKGLFEIEPEVLYQ